MKNTLVCLWISFTLVLPMISSNNFDGCKNLGDSCISLKTGRSGYCFPNYELTPPGSLSCDYKSDVLSLDEVIALLIERYCASGREGDLKRNAINRSWRTPQVAKVLQKIFNIVGYNPVNVLKDERITALRTELSQTLWREGSLPHLGLIPVSDNCRYIGQECVCPTTGRKGVCSVTRQSSKNELKVACLCE